MVAIPAKPPTTPPTIGPTSFFVPEDVLVLLDIRDGETVGSAPKVCPLAGSSEIDVVVGGVLSMDEEGRSRVVVSSASKEEELGGEDGSEESEEAADDVGTGTADESERCAVSAKLCAMLALKVLLLATSR